MKKLRNLCGVAICCALFVLSVTPTKADLKSLNVEFLTNDESGGGDDCITASGYCVTFDTIVGMTHPIRID